jgi:hypothetical protein
MGLAAQAVTLAPQEMRKEVIKKAADKLMVGQKTLENFTRNLTASDDRIKSSPARMGFKGISDNFSDQKHVELILKILGPVPKEYRDARYKHR